MSVTEEVIEIIENVEELIELPVETSEVIEMLERGPTGADGADGQDGAPGADGTGDKAYVHNQNSASAVWNINHNLNKYPSVMIVDSAGSVVIGDILYIDANNLTVTFVAAFSGKAYVN